MAPCCALTSYPNGVRVHFRSPESSTPSRRTVLGPSPLFRVRFKGEFFGSSDETTDLLLRRGVERADERDVTNVGLVAQSVVPVGADGTSQIVSYDQGVVSVLNY